MEPTLHWMSPPKKLGIAVETAHLWMVDLRASLLQRPEAVLPPDEVARAGRFRFERDRLSNLVSSYALRDILSRYLGIPPLEVPIATTAKGKPYLAIGSGQRPLQFSLSHTKEVAVVALAMTRVGVDIEGVPEGYPVMDVAERFFAAGEVEALRAEVDPQRRTLLFLRYWTKKEALLKASGEGLHGDLKGLDMSRAGPQVEHAGARWTVAEMTAGGSLLICLAVEGKLAAVEPYRWEPLGVP